MKTRYLNLIAICNAFLLFSTPLIAKDTADSLILRKNTIRINITNPMLFGEKYNVIGYERLLKNNQSVSLNTGRFTLPKFESYHSDLLDLDNEYDDFGYTLALDYRFYLRKENKYAGLRGVYIGPYYSYNYFRRENNWDLSTLNYVGSVQSEVRTHMNLFGFQMGYQFLLFNRIALDLIFFGPGIWFYNISGKLDTTLDAEDEELIFNELNKYLEERLPGRDFTIKPGDWVRSGSENMASMGFRYLINVGYRF